MRKTSAYSDRLAMALAWSADSTAPAEDVARALQTAVPELSPERALLVAEVLDRARDRIGAAERSDAEKWHRRLSTWTAAVAVPAGSRARVEAWNATDYAGLLYMREGRRFVRNLLAGRTHDDDGPDTARRSTVVADIVRVCGVSRSTAERALDRAISDPGCMRLSVAAEVGGSHICSADCPAPPTRFRAIELVTENQRKRMHRKAVEHTLQEGGRSLAAARRWRQLHPDRDPATAPRARRYRRRASSDYS